jgi:hypothetical protein
MKAVEEIRKLIEESRSRDRFIDATEIALAAQTTNQSYSVGELVSIVVEHAVALPQIR